MKPTKNCILINSEQELQDLLKKKESIFILFYAPWCGFSQMFLPVYEKCAQDTQRQCYRMMIDEFSHLCDKYSIEVYPTVLFFENGKVTKRLDGMHGAGLSEQQFRELIRTCDLQQ